MTLFINEKELSDKLKSNNYDGYVSIEMKKQENSYRLIFEFQYDIFILGHILK